MYTISVYEKSLSDEKQILRQCARIIFLRSFNVFFLP